MPGNIKTINISSTEILFNEGSIFKLLLYKKITSIPVKIPNKWDPELPKKKNPLKLCTKQKQLTIIIGIKFKYELNLKAIYTSQIIDMPKHNPFIPSLKFVAFINNNKQRTVKINDSNSFKKKVLSNVSKYILFNTKLSEF